MPPSANSAENPLPCSRELQQEPHSQSKNDYLGEQGKVEKEVREGIASEGSRELKGEDSVLSASLILDTPKSRTTDAPETTFVGEYKVPHNDPKNYLEDLGASMASLRIGNDADDTYSLGPTSLFHAAWHSRPVVQIDEKQQYFIC